jgi:CDP-glycerol glycerophosphotransferase
LDVERFAANDCGAVPAAAPASGVPSREELAALQKSIVELNRNVLAQLRHVALAVENGQVNERLREAARISPKERRVAFIGGPGFAGNIKYAWLDFAQRAKAWDVECWFAPQTAEQDEFAKALGVPHFPYDWRQWTREHTGAALRTAVRVIDTHHTAIACANPYQHSLFSGAHEVQLWHGISIKEIALRSNVPLQRMSLGHAQNLASCRMELFCGASAAAEPEWRRWFNFDRYANLGYPRNDVLLREPTELDLLNVDTAALTAARTVRDRGGKVFFYAPTFRDVRDAGGAMWLQPDTLNALADGLARHGHLLLVNLHPFEQGMQPQFEAACPRVGFVAARTDIYPLLRQADALVTDYSSLMFDFLMTGRPIIWFRPDHEHYIAKSRALYDGKLDRPLGPLATQVDDLVRECAAVDRQNPAYAEIRGELRDQLFDIQDAGASERTSALVLAEVERVLGAGSRH